MPEDILMKWIAIGVIIFMAYLALKRFFEKHPIPRESLSMCSISPYSVNELLKFIVFNKETRNRLLVTLGINIFSTRDSYPASRR